VVNGVNLFVSRGNLRDAIVGGSVMAMIENGLGILGLSSGLKLATTGRVLPLAVTTDANSRKRV
jgi:D-xylose transport system permease protein